jgi:hypothetical protein
MKWVVEFRPLGGFWQPEGTEFASVGSDAYEAFLVWKQGQPQRDYEYRLVAGDRGV